MISKVQGSRFKVALLLHTLGLGLGSAKISNIQIYQSQREDKQPHELLPGQVEGAEYREEGQQKQANGDDFGVDSLFHSVYRFKVQRLVGSKFKVRGSKHQVQRAMRKWRGRIHHTSGHQSSFHSSADIVLPMAFPTWRNSLLS